ncbi:MAG: hypothetical protein ABSC05_29805 [Candidatus Solibacter sp.]|jgi:hypothetical protein
MRDGVLRLLGFALLLVGAASLGFAQDLPDAPEIDPGMATVTLALVAGAALIVRSGIRRRRQYDWPSPEATRNQVRDSKSPSFEADWPGEACPTSDR